MSLVHWISTVIAVYTAADFDGMVESFTRPFYKNVDPDVERRSALQIAPYRADLLARDRVIRLDEPLAVVVATDRYIAEDALELIARGLRCGGCIGPRVPRGKSACA
jgi:carbon-monoxide dehydrogenase large subunit